jgi:hypothetical protein
MSSPISERRASRVLADEEGLARAGTLGHSVHLPGEWLSSLVTFISNVLPRWRDDPERPAQAGETSLTAQLCSRLNSVSRRTPGWDFLQFKREEPDESDVRRSIDLAVAPSGSRIWIEGREYTDYRTLLPLECKRLPTPPGTERDEREYLFSRFRSAGGVQRFKAGLHGAHHARAAMIGYVQERDIVFWTSKLDAWIDGIVREAVSGWSAGDKLELTTHDSAARVASLQSDHSRCHGLDPIRIDHLWIEM